MMPRTSTRFALAVLTVMASACADSTPPVTGVTDAMLTRDVGNDAGSTTSQYLAEMAGMEGLVGLPLTSIPGSPASAFGNCFWSVQGQLFECPAVTTPDGLKLARYFWIYNDGTSQPQQTYDPLATDSVLFAAYLTGSIPGTDRTIWVKHGLHVYVTGLTGTETQRTFRGSAAREDSVRVSADGIARTTHIDSHDVIDNVVFRLPRADFPFPQSGTITHDVTVSATTPDGTGAAGRSGTRHVAITFDGTRTASLTVGTTSCRLDLVTRAVSCQ